MTTRNHKQFIPLVVTLFSLFLNGKMNEQQLVDDLRELESMVKKNPNSKKSLWFKFFKDDTAATSIFDIENDLKRNSRNRAYIIDCLTLAVNNPNGVKIHFS